MLRAFGIRSFGGGTLLEADPISELWREKKQRESHDTATYILQF